MITDVYDPRGESHIKGRDAFNTTHYLLSYIFHLNTLKGTTKAPAVDLLRLNTLRGTKTAFLDPESYDEHPCPFYMEVPPPPRVYDMYSV